MLKPPESPAAEHAEHMDYKINLNNIDELMGELSQPVQDFTPKPEPGSETQTSSIYDPVGNAYGRESEPMTPEQAARNGERTALFFDGILSMGAQTVAKAETREPYRASPEDLDDIGKAWADYTKDKPFNLPPWATLAVLYITVYLPKITKAFNDRRLNDLSDRITKLEKKEEDGV